MRHTAIRMLLSMTIGLVAAAPVGADQPHDSVPFEPFTVPGSFCGFPDSEIAVEAVSNNEHQDVTTLADGTTVTRIRGRLVVSFTSTATGITIIRNVSGPTTTIARRDGTGTVVGEGDNWFIFGPLSQANIQQPGLVFTSGLVVLQFVGNVITSFSLKGKLINGCDLLAG